MSRVSKSDVMGMLEEHGAIASGHFELLSGLHSPTFITTAVALQYPHIAQKFAAGICGKFPEEVDVVLAATAGAAIVGQEVARRKKCRAISVERLPSGMILKRDFRISLGEKVLVVQDVLTTGRSTSEAVSLALAYGATVVGVGAVVDRSSAPLPLRIAFRSLVSYPSRVYSLDTCPLCVRNVPLKRPMAEGEKI